MKSESDPNAALNSDREIKKTNELNELLTKEGLKLSNIFMFFKNLSNENYVIGVEKLIEKVAARSDLEKISKLYHECFSNIPDVNSDYLLEMNFENYGVYVWGKLAAAFSLNRVSTGNEFYVQVIFLATSIDFRGQGYGKESIAYIKSRYEGFLSVGTLKNTS